MLLCGVVKGTFAQYFTVKGVVCEAAGKRAAEYVNVVLQTTDSVFVAGAVTDGKGQFCFRKVKENDYLLAFSSVGYATQYVSLDGVNRDIDLGKIGLKDAAVSLDGVTVSGSAHISNADRKLVFPSERQVKISKNGVDLLQQLMLPRIQVNPINNEIGLSGGGELQLRVNGVKAGIDEIKALRPEDVLRVEYHDSPGLRYGNAEIVVDYIVRRPETGGSFGFDLSQGLNAMWGDYIAFGKVNHKKSEFGLSYKVMPRDFYGMYRDNEEMFRLADGTTLHRMEQGEPDRATMLMHNLTANYNYYPSEKSMFNATFRLWDYNNPHMDYHGILYNVDNQEDKINMIDRTAESGIGPSLDLYYQYNMDDKQTLVLNAVGTYNRNKSHRLYQESQHDRLLTDIDNRVRGDKYSLIGEAIYEKMYSKGNALSFGLRHTQAYSDNDYRNGHDYKTNMRQGDTYVYGEYKGKADKLDYRLGIGASRFYYNQSGSDGSYVHYSFNPRVMLRYAFSDGAFLRWQADIDNASPSLSNLGAVEQVVDSLQIRRGNPDLESYLCYHTDLTFEWKKGLFYANLWGAYDYQPNAIMDEKVQEGNKIVQTWNNQKDWQKLAGRLMLRVGPIKDRLQLAFTGGVNHYMSHGNNYSHTYTNWFCEATASFNYKWFSLFWQINTNWNSFWGETLSGGENIQMVGMYYTHKNLRIGGGAFNPFTNNYKVQSENRNRFASYKKTNYIKESSHMFVISLSYNFSFGRTFKATQRKVYNSDDNSGVMSTGK